MLKFLSKNFKKILLYFLLTILLVVTAHTLLIGYNILKTGLVTEKTDIKYYHSALNNCHDKEGIIHFPKEIPTDAKDIYFYSYSAGLGGQTILIEFKINKEYIQNEINNPLYNKLSAIDIDYIFSHGRGKTSNFNTKQYTFYKLKRKTENSTETKLNTNGYSGIATNKELTQILYYYINPEF